MRQGRLPGGSPSGLRVEVDAESEVVGAMSDGAALFSMEAGPLRAGELRVVGFRGRESISRSYRWDVTVDAPNELSTVMDVALLAQPACLELSLPGVARRFVHGVIASVRRLSVSPEGDRVRLALRLVPRLWLLSLNRMSRVFQDASASEIVSELLDEAGIAWDSRLQHAPARRVYCVQYQESSLEFISRLLAEEGIFYYFEQPPFALSEIDAARSTGALVQGALCERLVLADGVGGVQRIPPRCDGVDLPPPGRAPTLFFRQGEGTLPEENDVSVFSRARVVRPQAVVLRDYDFRWPSAGITASQTAVPVSADLGTGEGFIDTLRDTIEGVGRASRESVPTLAIDPTLATVFEHHGEHEDPDVSRVAAQSRLEQVRGRVEVARGESWCRRLSPGHRFGLELHRDDSLDGEYTVTDVVHLGATEGGLGEGGQRTSYRNTFKCLPAYAAPRPDRPKRARLQVIETARVMGPAGEEIYTDPHGRIKVRFHWDLHGPDDGRSSCWIRPAQAWSGGGWGTQFIPRVGMEVLVSFLGGDGDRPVVLGCVYNGENAPPFGVLGDRTRSGIRTNSSPGGGGYNELSFEDARGMEQVSLRAERNLDERVMHDRSARVDHDDSTTIGRNQTLNVLGDQTERVSGNQTVHVERERRETTDGGVTVTTRGPEHRWNLERVEHRVEGRAKYVHTAAVDEDFEDERTVRAKGCVTTLVGAVDEERHWGLHVEGTSEHYASKGHEVTSPEGITLRSGPSSIAISPAGVDIIADVITIRSGNTVITVDAKSIAARAEDTITVEGQKKARLLAPDVSLTKADALEEAEQPPAPTRILLTDTRGAPLPGKRYRVRQEDGTVRAGFLDADGAATIPGEQGGQVEFPAFDEVQS